MAEIVLNVEVRERTGTGGARVARRAGQVPGILYGGDTDMRIRQEMILGIGGVRALRALGKQPFVHKGGYTSHHVDALGCLNAAVDFRCAYRKSNASILVMQSPQDRTAQNASCCLGGT